MATAQIGLMIEGQAGLNWDNWKAILKTAEDTGYQSVFRSDHFIIGEAMDSLELWTSLTYAATATERIEFGPLVTPITFRQPGMNARYATAVDDLSGGRLIYGMGAGWHEDEHIRWGVPFYDFPTRFEMLEDAIHITDKLFKTDGEVTHEGKHFSVKGAYLLPRPQKPGGPTLLVGGNGPKKTLPMAAEFAAEWNAVFIDQETYKARQERLDMLLEERGRQPSDVKRSLMTRVVYGENEAAVKARLDARGEDGDEMRANDRIIGTPQEIVDQLGAWTELGVERFMLQWLDLDDTEGMVSMAETVLPHLHG
ncbi:MAG: TIGR03560 family F420-dependent LLM class oxidoreductase [Chloroflexota bacterium]